MTPLYHLNNEVVSVSLHSSISSVESRLVFMELDSWMQQRRFRFKLGRKNLFCAVGSLTFRF